MTLGYIIPVRGDLSIDYLKPSNNNHDGKDKSKDKSSGSSNVYANNNFPKPIVRQDNGDRELLHDPKLHKNSTLLYYYPHLGITSFNQTKDEILNLYNWDMWVYYDRELLNYSKKYNIITAIPKGNLPSFVVRKINVLYNSKSIGYLILDPILIEMPKTDPSILKMKNLPEIKNGKFFDGLKKYKYMDLKVYEKEHNGFIERYVILIENNKEESLIAEMFYPKELDREFKPEITRSLNLFMKRLSNAYKAYLKEITSDEYWNSSKELEGDVDIDYLKPSNNNHD